MTTALRSAAYLCLILSLPVAADERRYTFMTIGEPSGSQVTTTGDDGLTTVVFEFNDRGRGPETTTRYRLNDAGIPVEIHIDGVNYRKGEVNERFVVDGDTAIWKSSIEEGSAALAGDEFFLPNNAPPELQGVLARALLADDDNSLPILPSGTASINALGSRTVVGGDGEKVITLYAISGISTAPRYVWLDADGEFFGVDNGWFGITAKSFESHIDTLKADQEEADDAFYVALARDLTKPIEGQLVISGARIFDSIEGALTPPATVFVWDGKIAAVYFDEVDIPGDALVVDGRGKTLLPGLWDMHAHIGIINNFNYLAAGVTNIRDMANDPATIFKFRSAMGKGTMAGPDIYSLGFIDKRGEFSAPTGLLADELPDAIEFVDYYAQHGFIGIKLYSSIEPDWVAPIAEYAHMRGLEVMGHVPAFMNAGQAIDAGYDEITHINMVLLNFLGAEELDTRTPTRFRVPGERAADLDLDSREVREFISLLKEKNIAVDPTLTIFLNMFENTPGEVEATFRDIADHLPASVRRNSISAKGYNDGNEAVYARSAEKTRQLVKLLHENGVRVLPGTDNSLPGFTLIYELINYVDAGIPTAETLQLATIEPARHLGVENRLGSVSVGKGAHLVLIDGDPVQDIRDLYRVEYVVKGRQLFHAPSVLEKQGFAPFTH